MPGKTLFQKVYSKNNEGSAIYSWTLFSYMTENRIRIPVGLHTKIDEGEKVRKPLNPL